MQKIIVNSTPMIILSKIGMLSIMHRLFGEIIIPQAVYDEITCKSDVISKIIRDNRWIKVSKISSNADRSMYKSKLHDGEVEVMILAQEMDADILAVIDDNAAKKTAKYLGINVIGTLGVLVMAKKRGYLGSIQKVIQLMKHCGFYGSTHVEEQVLKVGGEL